jgi:PBP1b-binding outer membrane lipoprotein LpoB
MKKSIPAIAMLLAACAATPEPTDTKSDADQATATQPSSPESRVTENYTPSSPAVAPPSPNVSSDVTYSNQR